VSVYLRSNIPQSQTALVAALDTQDFIFIVSGLFCEILSQTSKSKSSIFGQFLTILATFYEVNHVLKKVGKGRSGDLFLI
jgi:hypothetical protein